jgi:hypothetical protein
MIMIEEFVNSKFPGKEYRRKCYEEMISTIFDAMKNRMTSGAIMASNEPLRYFSKRVFEAQRNVEPFISYQERFARELVKRGSLTPNTLIPIIEEKNVVAEDKAVLFHFKAYLFLLRVEGIFDDIARLWYFFKKLSVDPSYEPKIQDLKSLDVNGVIRLLRAYHYPIPVFLENWEEKNSWRNAIAHCTASFDPTMNTIDFVDYTPYTDHVAYEEVVTLYDFQTRCLEIEGTIGSFELAIRIMQLVSDVARNLPPRA